MKIPNVEFISPKLALWLLQCIIYGDYKYITLGDSMKSILPLAGLMQ